MIIGHHKQWGFLKNSIENNRISHAYLFYGPTKIGKKTIALDFAKLLVNPASKSNIVSDLTYIEPECAIDKEGEKKEASKAIIPVAQIFNLKKKLSLSAVSDNYKVAIIEEAPSMTSDAQGALLKLLEEPRGKTVIILLSEQLNQLASTIVSRCQAIRFDLLSNKEIEKYLIQENISSKKAQEISWLSFGKPGIAIDCLNSLDEEKFQRERIKEINYLTDSSLKIRFEYAEKLSKKRDEAIRVLEIWLNYFHELLLDKLGNKQTLAPFKKKSYSVQKLRKNINLVEKIKFVLSHTNTNPRLAIEVLLMKM